MEEKMIAPKELEPFVPAPRRSAPFLKWAGGKRSLLPQILARAPKGIIRRYVEPFVGGGAVFFELAAQERVERATLVDANEELARAYLAVRDEPKRLVAELRGPRYVYEKDAYYAMRALDPTKLDAVSAAARTIYLNKCGFNGLYRVNKSGGFNVPFGRYDNPRICDEEGILAASRALSRATIRLTDFEVACEDAFTVVRNTEIQDEAIPASDFFIYADPPYLPLSATSSFTSYTQDGFSLGDHERLRDYLLKLRDRGVRWLLSNSDAPAIRSLYDRSEFVVEEIECARAINSAKAKRGKIKELLIAPSGRKA